MGQIVTLDVAPEFRRRGVGRLLMQDSEARLRDRGAELLRLEVAVNNSSALDFYGSLGFQPIAQIPDYYADGLDAIVMEKSLSQSCTFIG